MIQVQGYYVMSFCMRIETAKRPGDIKYKTYINDIPPTEKN